MQRLTWLFILFFPLRLCAACCEENPQGEWTLEVRGAYYSPLSKMMRKIYSSGWLDYQIEASKRISPLTYLWASVNWASKQHGKMWDGSFRHQTKIYVLPLSIGLKVSYPILACADVYLGGGVCYSFLNIHNCHPYYCPSDSFSSYPAPHPRDIYKSAWGGVIKVGFYYQLGGHVFLDLFADYFAQHFRASKHHAMPFQRYIDCSGFKLGAGFGVDF